MIIPQATSDLQPSQKANMNLDTHALHAHHGALPSHLAVSTPAPHLQDLRATVALLHQRIEFMSAECNGTIGALKARLSAIVAPVRPPDLLADAAAAERFVCTWVGWMFVCKCGWHWLFVWGGGVPACVCVWVGVAVCVDAWFGMRFACKRRFGWLSYRPPYWSLLPGFAFFFKHRDSDTPSALRVLDLLFASP
eukprot:357339-Chlamydomonas_euryale.AAC.3